MPEKQQRITIPTLAKKLKAVLEGKLDPTYQTVIGLSSPKANQFSSNIPLKERLQELMTKLGYEFHKARAIAED